MRILLARLENRILSNTLWIYLTLFLFLSYLLVITMLQDSFGYYLLSTAKLSIIYLPSLLYALFRSLIRNKVATSARSILWGLCFLVWPLLVLWQAPFFSGHFIGAEMLRPHRSLDHEFPFYFFLAVSGSVIGTEIAIQISNDLLQRFTEHPLLETLGVEKALFIGTLLLSLPAALLGVVHIMERQDLGGLTDWPYLIWKFVSYSFQFALIGSMYFFYYYLNKRWLIPRILRTKGAVYYGFSVAASILVFYPLFVWLITGLPLVRDLELPAFYPDHSIFAEDKGGGAFMVMLLSVPIIVSSQWFRQHDRIADLEKEKLETELTLLKQQINPHFFFNTLNNLYALSIDHDRRTPEVILQLSEQMRYVIYRGKRDLVPLPEEVKYIEDYIHLQQIRLHKKLNFVFTKEIEDEQLPIPPLLFITFVENAFKHGIEAAGGDCDLELHLRASAKEIRFQCVNSLEALPEGPPGIGLNNLRRRLELRFPGRHSIDVGPEGRRFKATLQIENL